MAAVFRGMGIAVALVALVVPAGVAGATDTGDTGLVDGWDTATHARRGGGDGGVTADDFTANAGLPFLAYPGDTVILSAEQSSGPQGVQLEYLWTQASGPAVVLDDPTDPTPSFVPDVPGIVTVDLQVGAGGVMSAADRSYVVVIDRDAGRAHDAGGCGCGSTVPLAGWWPLVLVGFVFRRR